MFYTIYEKLCAEKGVSPSRAAEDCGINKANVSTWKNQGYTPRGAALNRIAEYFGVTVDYLLTGEQKEVSAQTDTLKDTIDVTTDEFTYAMYNEGKELSEEDKRTLLEMAQFLKNKKKGKPDG